MWCLPFAFLGARLRGTPDCHSSVCTLIIKHTHYPYVPHRADIHVEPAPETFEDITTRQFQPAAFDLAASTPIPQPTFAAEPVLDQKPDVWPGTATEKMAATVPGDTSDGAATIPVATSSQAQSGDKRPRAHADEASSGARKQPRQDIPTTAADAEPLLDMTVSDVVTSEDSHPVGSETAAATTALLPAASVAAADTGVVPDDKPDGDDPMVFFAEEGPDSEDEC